MLPCSMRRVIATAYQTPIRSSFSPLAASTGPGLWVAGRRHASQRRFSSSKPSSSGNGSKKVATDGSVPAAVERPKPKKRKTKTAPKAASPPALPSVPNTNHVSEPSLALTSFFSLHRPISITEGYPSTVSNDSFAAIFASRGSTRPSDVMSTLSSTINNVEPATKFVIRTKNGDPPGEQEVRVFQHVENNLPSVFDGINAMSGDFAPYTIPPSPQHDGEQVVTSQGEAKAQAQAQAQAGPGEAGQTVRYTALMTIDRTTKPNGEVLVVPRLIQLNTSNPKDKDARRRRRMDLIKWYLISVKRIRKLKMKKKKYKKIMKKTRNMRRKLDKL